MHPPTRADSSADIATISQMKHFAREGERRRKSIVFVWPYVCLSIPSRQRYSGIPEDKYRFLAYTRGYPFPPLALSHCYLLTFTELLAEHFTILEPKNPSIDDFYQFQKTPIRGFWVTKFVECPVGRSGCVLLTRFLLQLNVVVHLLFQLFCGVFFRKETFSMHALISVGMWLQYCPTTDPFTILKPWDQSASFI